MYESKIRADHLYDMIIHEKFLWHKLTEKDCSSTSLFLIDNISQAF